MYVGYISDKPTIQYELATITEPLGGIKLPPYVYCDISVT